MALKFRRFLKNNWASRFVSRDCHMIRSCVSMGEGFAEQFCIITFADAAADGNRCGRQKFKKCSRFFCANS